MVLEILGGSLAKSVAVINEGSMLVIDILTNFIRICGAFSLDRRTSTLTLRGKPELQLRISSSRTYRNSTGDDSSVVLHDSTDHICLLHAYDDE